MKYRTRTYHTDVQKALMWEPWKQGCALHQIAKLFDRGHTSVQGILSASGGIRLAQRHRRVRMYASVSCSECQFERQVPGKPIGSERTRRRPIGDIP
jgi:hypothetical protein